MASEVVHSVLSHFTKNLTRDKFNDYFTFDNLADICSRWLIALSLWAALWGLFPRDASPPNGYIFNVLLVLFAAHLFGRFMSVFNLPPLLGMLMAGFCLVNRTELGFAPLRANQKLNKTLRHIALVIVLLRAGLEIDNEKLRKLTGICLKLSFIPTIVETATIAVMLFITLDLSLEWGFLTGFMLSAVSPAVIIPPLLNLRKDGIGMDKGIPSLLIASASIDDILAIAGFGLCVKLIFEGQKNLIYVLFKVFAEPLIGVMTGILIGLTLWFVPSADSSEPQKLFLLTFGGLAADFIFNAFHMRAAGPEACFLAALVASLKWRYDRSFERIEKDLNDFWLMFEPLLFGLIGAEVKIEIMKQNYVYLLFLSLCVGLTMRFMATLLVTFGTNFTMKEKIFIGFAWTPKATFQAAVAPLVLELALNASDDIKMRHAQKVLIMAFLSIILTAPLGAVAISILGPKVLNIPTKEEVTRRRAKKMRRKQRL